MESSAFFWFLIYTKQINARNLERVARTDKNISPATLLVMKKKRTKDANI